MKLKGIDGGPHKRRNIVRVGPRDWSFLRDADEGAAWLSSARVVRCRLKCHNERNPIGQLPSSEVGDSVRTAIARCEEGWDDVKSARPLRPGLHTCYNGGHSGKPCGDAALIPKSPLSSDWSLQPDSTKLDSLVIAHQPWRGEYVPGPCRSREGRSRASPVTGAKS